MATYICIGRESFTFNPHTLRGLVGKATDSAVCFPWLHLNSPDQSPDPPSSLSEHKFKAWMLCWHAMGSLLIASHIRISEVNSQDKKITWTDTASWLNPCTKDMTKNEQILSRNPFYSSSSNLTTPRQAPAVKDTPTNKIACSKTVTSDWAKMNPQVIENTAKRYATFWDTHTAINKSWLQKQILFIEQTSVLSIRTLCYISDWHFPQSLSWSFFLFSHAQKDSSASARPLRCQHYTGFGEHVWGPQALLYMTGKVS